MGTTLTALQTGSINYKMVIAIEGIPYLLTDATPAQALAAWTGTDWTQALSNIIVDVQNESVIDPFTPFTSGGTCTISVLPDSVLGDILGVMVGRSNAGAETLLTATMNRTTATATVMDTTDFAASGECYIGIECVGYTGKTSTTLTGLVRGKYAPFAAGALTSRYAMDHRTGLDPTGTALAPVVSLYPRTWKGRQIGAWMHRVDGGVLDVRSEAQLIYAGRIAEARDDANTGACVIDCKHVLDDIKDFVVFDDPWMATVSAGVYLPLGTQFFWSDINTSGVQRSATTLTVVAVPAAAYEIAPDTYTLSALCDKLNAWLSSEKAAGNLHYDYAFTDRYDTASGVRGKLTFKTTGAAGLRIFLGVFPSTAGTLLGYPPVNGQSLVTRNEGVAGTYDYDSPAEPCSAVFPASSTTGFTMTFEDAHGQYFDNTSYLGIDPALLASYPSGWGLFIVDNRFAITGYYDGSSNQLQFIERSWNLGGPDTQSWLDNGVPVSSDGQSTIQQVLFLNGQFSTLLNTIFFSTGTVGYNGASDTGFPGLGIPNELLGATFTDSTAALQNSGMNTPVYVTKPTKLAELMGADLIIRRANLLWKNQHLLMSSWSTPSAALSLHNLTEANKAEPGQGTQRSATALTEMWLKNVVKIEYHRNLLDGRYTKFYTLKDRTSIDDHGGRADTMTISLPHNYNEDPATDVLVANYLAFMPALSRANPILVRSIAPTHFENVAAGDIVTINDGFARDPITGQRGVVSRTGIIISHKYSPGGARFDGGTDTMVGEVQIMMGAIDRNVTYCPTALSDATANTGGFTGGYDSVNFKLRTVNSAYGDGPTDAANFVAGDKVRIVRVDQSIAAPDTWLRTVSSVSGTDITLTSSLSAPSFGGTVRIYSDDYTTATATQKLNAYQALSTTGRIASVAPAGVYTLTNVTGPFTLSVHTEPGELIPTLASGDGAPIDTGTDYALATTANWIQDHHTKHMSPMLASAPVSYASGAGFKTLMFSPIYVGGGSTQTGTRRYLNVAPFFRSTDGSSVTLRVTLLRNRPTSNVLVDATLPGPYAQVTFTTTSTWNTPATAALDLSLLGPACEGYLLIEATQKCETYGLASVSESHRQ